MASIDEGNNGRIYDLGSTVKKIQKRGSLGHDVLTQKRIHTLTEKLLGELHTTVLKTPSIVQENFIEYEMAKIDTSNIIYLGDPNHGYPLDFIKRGILIQELALFWKTLFEAGFAAWDFELFLQSDGTVMMLDFDKFGFRMTSGPLSIHMPSSRRNELGQRERLEFFFHNPCFPHDFVERLRALGFKVPADCLPSL